MRPNGQYNCFIFYITLRFCVGSPDDGPYSTEICSCVWIKTKKVVVLDGWKGVLLYVPLLAWLASRKNYSLGNVQRFCYHSWCDSTVIFEQTSNSCNVYLSSSRFWTATSLVIFYRPLSIWKSRIEPKNVWSVQSLTPISLLHQY